VLKGDGRKTDGKKKKERLKSGEMVWGNGRFTLMKKGKSKVRLRGEGGIKPPKKSHRKGGEHGGKTWKLGRKERGDAQGGKLQRGRGKEHFVQKGSAGWCNRYHWGGEGGRTMGKRELGEGHPTGRITGRKINIKKRGGAHRRLHGRRLAHQLKKKLHETGETNSWSRLPRPAA